MTCLNKRPLFSDLALLTLCLVRDTFTHNYGFCIGRARSDRTSYLLKLL